MSAVFVHDQQQHQQAEAKKAALATQLGTPIHTKILPVGPFYLAEDYHQKYALRSQRQLMAEFQAIYPQLGDFVNSTAVARANGFASGYGTLALLESELASYGLSSSGQAQLVRLAKQYLS